MGTKRTNIELDEALALEGTGWEGDLDVQRSSGDGSRGGSTAG
jgi:hypothetical protein